MEINKKIKRENKKKGAVFNLYRDAHPCMQNVLWFKGKHRTNRNSGKAKQKQLHKCFS